MCLTALLEPTPHHRYFSAFCREWLNKGVFSKKLLAAQLPWWHAPCRAISHPLGLANPAAVQARAAAPTLAGSTQRLLASAMQQPQGSGCGRCWGPGASAGKHSAPGLK